MAAKTYHLALSIAGTLRQPDAHLDGLLKVDGKTLSPHQARQWLRIEQNKGRKVLPCGDGCEAFDYQNGCPGHPVEVPEAWHRNDEATLTCMLLVSEAAHVTREQIASWSDAQCKEAEAWALAVHYRASDNNVRVPPKPGFIAEWDEKVT